MVVVHKHSKCSCRHELKYCKCCDKVYCTKCSREWGGYWQYNWNWYPANQCSSPYYYTSSGSTGTLAGGVDDAKNLSVTSVASSCSHGKKQPRSMAGKVE
jgi:hypothetical protein